MRAACAPPNARCIARARRARPKHRAAAFLTPIRAAAAPDADDAAVDDAPSDPWLEDRRAYLSALTVEKGLKPLCRGYGLKLGGSKGALLERVLAHESANRSMMAPMEEVVKKATSWRNSRVVSVERPDARAEARLRERRARVDEAGGWGRSEEEDDGEDVNDDGWGSSWAKRADREEASTTERMLELEAKYPELRPASEKVSKDDLARRVAVVNGLRALAKDKSGYEADTGMHLEAIARAITTMYKEIPGSALRLIQRERRDARLDVSVDIDVERGRFAVLVQVFGRSGTVEREYDDTKFFTFNIRRQNRMRTLIRYMSEEMKSGVARMATENYVEQIGSLCVGTTRFRSEDGSWMVDIADGAAGVIPPEEQLQLFNDRQLKQGDEVSCYVLDVDQNLFTGREQTPVVLSMTIPAVVAAIIRDEVPEIAKGDVEIKAIARIAGKITKVAVAPVPGSSIWNTIDVCVGVDQVRLKRIRERAGGEVVHFINWSDDPSEVVKAALFPADVKSVEKSFPDGSQRPKFTAYVSEFDVKRAIGTNGNNVKLCAALTNSFVVIEAVADSRSSRRSSSFNDDPGDGFDYGSGGFWGDDRDDEFGATAAEKFADILKDDRFGERRQGVVLDDLGWPEFDEFEDMPTSKPAVESKPKAELKTLDEALGDRSDGDEDAPEEWVVGPGRPGLVTFGATGRAGVVGSALFLGDEDSDELYDDDEVIFD